MASKDRSNQSPEPITVRRQRAGKVSMALPRQDDGMVHKASGVRNDSTAARFADAMDSVVGGPSAAGRAFEQGG